MSGRARTGALLLAGAAGGAVAVYVGRAAGFAVSVPVALLGGLALAAAVALGLALPPDDPPVTAVPAPEHPAGSAAFGDLGLMRYLVESDARDAERLESRLRPRLAGLAVERLWQRHRLDWRTDPGRAAAAPLLGPGLTTLLTAPPGSLRLDPGTLLDLIREMEEL